ncbi:MAG: hypothetical protein H6631_08760 [Anaerolineaceae bacterium]|nr:hypothetical protein [Anaerolineaceae bacterium]
MRTYKLHKLLFMLVTVILAGFASQAELVQAASTFTIGPMNFIDKTSATSAVTSMGTDFVNQSGAYIPPINNQTTLNASSALTITKLAKPSSVPETGGVVTFTITISNSHIETGTLEALVDSAFGDLDLQPSCSVTQTLLPLIGVYSCEFTETVQGDFSGPPHQNTVTATVSYSSTGPISDTATAAVTFTNVSPHISVQKDNDANGDSTFSDTEQSLQAGVSVPFKVTMTNLNAEDVTIDAIVDDTHTLAGSDCANKVGKVLTATTSITCTFSGTIPNKDNITETNRITVTVSDNEGSSVAASDTSTVTTFDVKPQVIVSKTASPTSLLEPGGNVTFTISITNTGLETVTLNTLTDSEFGNLNVAGKCVIPSQPLPTLANYTCQFTQPISANFGDVSHVNTVTVTAADDDGNTTSAHDTATVTFIDAPSSLAVSKTATPTSVPEPGQNVIFSVIVTNTSSVDTIAVSSIVDDKFGSITGCLPPVPTSLGVGSKINCSFIGFVGGDGGETHTNTVTVSGTDDDGKAVSATASEDVDIQNVDSTILVSALANPTSIFEPSGLVTFTVVITNPSNADSVTINSLTDSLVNDLNGRGSCITPQLIDKMDHYQCTYTATVTGNAGDLPKANIITAIGEDSDHLPVQDTGVAYVSIKDVDSSIEVTTTANQTLLPEPGGLVAYTLIIKNTSLADDITINSLTDSIYGNLDGKSTCVLGQPIAPNTTYQCLVMGNFTGQPGASQTNTVTADVTDSDNKSFSQQSSGITFSIIDVPSAIDVIKSANPASVPEPGGPVNFTVKVKNISAADTVNLKSLTDNVYGNLNGKGTCAIGGNIAPGGQYQCSFTGNVSGSQGQSKTSTVTANVQDDDGQNRTDAGSATVTIGAAVIFKVNLPILTKPGLTLLSIQNDNTGGNVVFTVIGTGVSCTVPNNTTQFCGSFPPGIYSVTAQSTCGTATTQKTYGSGPQTTRIFCQ